MEPKMSDSVREASNNPAFKAAIWVATGLLAVVISMGTYIFASRGDTDERGRQELKTSIDLLRTDLQSFSRTLQDQQTSMTLMQSRVTNLETLVNTMRDGVGKLRDDHQRDSYRIDRLEEVTNSSRSRGAR